MRFSTKSVSLFFVVACFVFPLHCGAATVSEIVEHGKYHYIAVEGLIAKGDFAKVIKLANSFVNRGKLLKILINSDGGDASEAMRIGRFVRSVLAMVKISGAYVKPSSPALRHCYSACVLVLVAAAKREVVMDNEFFTEGGTGVRETVDGKLQLKSVPIVGIHRPYYEREAYGNLSPAQAREQYATLEKATRQYLHEMGAPESFASEMFRYSSSEIHLISKEVFVGMFGHIEPFLQEWFLSKCGNLDAKERSDWAVVVTDRMFSKDDSFVPPHLSRGYADYLVRKQEEVAACEDRQLKVHQSSVIGKASKP